MSEMVKERSSSEDLVYGDESLTVKIAPEEEETEEEDSCWHQWSKEGDSFYPCGTTRKQITPGMYDICTAMQRGLYLRKCPVKVEDIVNLPQTYSEKVIQEIQKFWTLEDKFKKAGLAYKRGILLHGPQGSGKSCAIQILMADVIKRGGIVLKFGQPDVFLAGMMVVRHIQPEIPIVALMEDLDAILMTNPQSEILNILDGVKRLHKIVFLATTNHPERLGPNIINRPSRFDKRFHIDNPNAESRKVFIDHLFKAEEEMKIDVDKWVKDTAGFSMAHLKELYISTAILDDSYEESIKTLKDMMNQPEKQEGFTEKQTLGF